MANKLRNGLAYCPNCDLKDSLYASSHFFNKHIGTSNWLLLLLLLDRHKLCAVFFVVGIVDEHIILFRIYDSLDKLTSVITFTLKNLQDAVHDLGADCRHFDEDFINERRSQSLELCVRVLNEG